MLLKVLWLVMAASEADLAFAKKPLPCYVNCSTAQRPAKRHGVVSKLLPRSLSNFMRFAPRFVNEERMNPHAV